jgi:hypothetical protein
MFGFGGEWGRGCVDYTILLTATGVLSSDMSVAFHDTETFVLESAPE